MSKNIITCTTTPEQDIHLDALASAIGITRAEFFQRFWDGYTVDTQVIDGAVWSQVRQWIKERIDNEVAASPVLDKS